MSQWKCDKCGNYNEGQFCSNCGQPKRTSADSKPYVQNNAQTYASTQQFGGENNLPLSTQSTFNLLGSWLATFIALILSALCICYTVTLISHITQNSITRLPFYVGNAVLTGLGAIALWGVNLSSRKGDYDKTVRCYNTFSIFYIIRTIVGIIYAFLMWLGALLILFMGGCIVLVASSLSEQYGGTGETPPEMMYLTQILAWVLFIIGVIMFITYICACVTLSDVKRRIKGRPCVRKSRMFTAIVMLIIGVYYGITAVSAFTGGELANMSMEIAKSVLDEFSDNTNAVIANTHTLDSVVTALQSLVFLSGGVFVIRYNSICMMKD